MNLDSFLTLERERLLEERERLENERNGEQLAKPLTITSTQQHTKAQRNGEETQQQQQLSKDAKERVNLHNVQQQYKPNVNEQWVTDTFYNYFPGFGNEYQKRQAHLRERQRQNQENFLKHVPAAAAAGKENAAAQRRRAAKQRDDDASREEETARSYNMSVASRASGHTLDKTELEIIVNNPNYTPRNATTRPGSTRHKLLQDLRHTELSQIVSGDAIGERNRRSVELQSARKKDYQRELIAQIEEKRRLIKKLRDKERDDEEGLTKRLREQLKALRLEEQREKEKIFANQLQHDSEQNRLLRQELISKLEQDREMLQAKGHAKNDSVATEATKAQGSGSGNGTDQTHKVYQYFSNSAHREYRLGKPMPAAVEAELELDLPHALDDSDADCVHFSDRSCPLCESPLKNYHSSCLRCEKRQALAGGGTEHSGGDRTGATSRSFSLICEKCERLYSLCRTCLAQDAVCAACYCKRNICLNCRRALCTVCLDTMAVEGGAASPQVAFQSPHSAANGEDECSSSANTSRRPADTSIPTRPPYSMNIDRDSIFHPDYDLHKKAAAGPSLESSPVSELTAATEPFNVERVRKETDKRLSHYFKHYGDLAQLHSRSTQTTPESAGRRDIVLREHEHNLSIPLLREMPKMTRGAPTGAPPPSHQHQRSKIDTLKRRWEVPAVQKHTISPSNPRVLTQLGAMRKQLQAADFI